MDALVLAVPLACAVKLSPGLTTPPPLEVLQDIGATSWLATSAALAADAGAVTVEIAVLRIHQGQAWITEDGRLVVPLPVTVEELPVAGLAGLRQAAAQRASGARVELVGIVFDAVQWGRRMVLVYRAQGEAPPHGAGTWITATAAAGLPLDPLSRLVVPQVGL